MTIEQTNQLLLLLLNSLLWGCICVGVLIGVLVRHQVTSRPSSSREPGRDRPQPLSREVRGVTGVVYALWFNVGSTGCLVLRMVVPWDRLISVSLALFIVSLGILWLTLLRLLARPAKGRERSRVSPVGVGPGTVTPLRPRLARRPQR
jgi:hypothetical protein